MTQFPWDICIPSHLHSAAISRGSPSESSEQEMKRIMKIKPRLQRSPNSSLTKVCAKNRAKPGTRCEAFRGETAEINDGGKERFRC
jgi:hypothetical protein